MEIACGVMGLILTLGGYSTGSDGLCTYCCCL
jgi:hypothetical protein